MEWLAPIAAVLDKAGIRWVLMGAVAALNYRHSPRLTTDLDLLIESIAGLSDALREAGFEVREVADAGEPPHLLLVQGKGVHVDLIVVTVDYQQVALDRAVEKYLSVEDVIVHKLIAWRPRDRDDITSILKAGHHLDESYIDHWAGIWDVRSRWDEARHSR